MPSHVLKQKSGSDRSLDNWTQRTIVKIICYRKAKADSNKVGNCMWGFQQYYWHARWLHHVQENIVKFPKDLQTDSVGIVVGFEFKSFSVKRKCEIEWKGKKCLITCDPYAKCTIINSSVSSCMSN